MMNALKYIPAAYDIGKIKEALITGNAEQRAYALRLIDAWKLPSDSGFSDRDVEVMDRLGKHD